MGQTGGTNVADISPIIRALLVAAGFGITILIHEFGHFIMCKRIGVTVETFSIGFGPKLFSFKKGETEYRLSILPIGGYIKMRGEHPEDGSTGDPREFLSRTPFERIGIVIAGVALNAVLAIILFILAFSFGVPFVSSEIGSVEKYGPAYYAGLKKGDRIVAINGGRDVDFEDLFIEAALADEPLRLRVARDGEEFSASVMPVMSPQLGTQVIGVNPAFSTYVYRILKGSPAEAGGIKLNDQIVGINGAQIASWEDVQKICMASPGRALDFQVKRDGKSVDCSVTPETHVLYFFGWQTPGHTRIGKVYRNKPAEKAGIEEGDCILAVEGQEIYRWEELLKTMRGKYSRPFSFTVEKSTSEIVQMQITPELPPADETPRAYEEAGIVYLGKDMRIAALKEDSPLSTAGLHVNDIIVSVNGVHYSSPGQLDKGVQWSEAGEFDFDVLREGREISLKIALSPEIFEKRGVIDISADFDNVIGKIDEGSPAESIGMKPGDRIISLGGVKVQSLTDIGSGPVPAASLTPMEIVFMRDGVKYVEQITPAAVKGSGLGFIGITPAQKMVERRYPFLKSCSFGFYKTWMFAKQIYVVLQKLLTGRMSPRTLAGPIGIIAISYSVTAYGVTKLLYFLAILNINLAFLNLLPIPILDGGLIMFFLVEKAKGKPVNRKVMEYLQYAGIAILITLFVYLVFIDISRFWV